MSVVVHPSKESNIGGLLNTQNKEEENQSNKSDGKTQIINDLKTENEQLHDKIKQLTEEKNKIKEFLQT